MHLALGETLQSGRVHGSLTLGLGMTMSGVMSGDMIGCVQSCTSVVIMVVLGYVKGLLLLSQVHNKEFM